jgi:hypothetical protein
MMNRRMFLCALTATLSTSGEAQARNVGARLLPVRVRRLPVLGPLAFDDGAELLARGDKARPGRGRGPLIELPMRREAYHLSLQGAFPA